jgi:hypothetical protein
MSTILKYHLFKSLRLNRMSFIIYRLCKAEDEILHPNFSFRAIARANAKNKKEFLLIFEAIFPINVCEFF